jgi:mRNA-degrading endonuclease RelE of RelBE toxin-antitoxin system
LAFFENYTMTVLIASSFAKSLEKLTGQEQGQVKITAFDIQQNPDNPGLSLHRIDRARDSDFWSARVNRDLRIILHKRDGDTLLAYVDHHDDAYTWAERRRLDKHPKTGAAQIVEIRETVEEIVTKRFIEEAVQMPRLFNGIDDDTLLSWGVPEDWVETVKCATEDTILDIALHLPDEAKEAVLAAAVGETPTIRIAHDTLTGFTHPDALRRFRIVGDEKELASALDAPWDQWAVFLHPAQQEFVNRDFDGPARVIGSAGTGKTVVALHRAVRLASENEANRIFLTTFSSELTGDLSSKVDRLTTARPSVRARIKVGTLSDISMSLVEERLGDVALVNDQAVDELLRQVSIEKRMENDLEFLKDEWRLIVDAWDVCDADTYRDLPRLGRKVRMAQSRRDEYWCIFGEVRARLEAKHQETLAGLMHRLARNMSVSPYSHIIVDEAQDISVPELYLLAAMAGERPNGLFFAGDIGQRIFRSPFPWKAVGVDVQGRSRSLKVNYRTSHQIRAKSDLLLPSRLLEAGGGEDRRLGVTSIFHGPAPHLHTYRTLEDEIHAVAGWLKSCQSEGFEPATIAILVRSNAELERAEASVTASGITGIKVGLMHDAKGKEYRAVAVMACDSDIIPSETRLLSATDDRALQEIYDTERHLLYVAATRAREQLWLSACEPPSEFLEDLLMAVK